MLIRGIVGAGVGRTLRDAVAARDNRTMEFIAFVVDFILHVDVHLTQFVQSYGAWVYALLFAIIFVETGVVVMPFLPGDSLLFVVGALCGLGLMNLPLTLVLLVAAAVLGDQVNYSIGRIVGPRVFGWEQSRWFNRDAFVRTHAFYERYGAFALIAGRFMPFVRTFVPFVAGVAEMTRSRFTLFNVIGAVVWVIGITMAGYLFGNIPWVQANLSKTIWAMILIPGLIVLYGAWKARRGAVQPG
jgi:membrane-associated protein